MSWLLKDKVATWHQSNWSTRVDLRSIPTLNLSCPSSQKSLTLSLRPNEAEGNLNEVDYLPVGDCYVRQGDLVSHFPEKAPFHFGYEAYFCTVQSASECQILELWLSVQTSKLESNPQLRIQCQTTAPASQAIDTTSGHRSDLSKGLYLFEDNTLGILVHPMDQSDTVLEHDKDEHWTLVTFGRFMEKGVIRRMRLRIVASNDTISDSQWLAWMQSFADSPLPLTA
jgi:hypothetical protein